MSQDPISSESSEIKGQNKNSQILIVPNLRNDNPQFPRMNILGRKSQECKKYKIPGNKILGFLGLYLDLRRFFSLDNPRSPCPGFVIFGDSD